MLTTILYTDYDADYDDDYDIIYFQSGFVSLFPMNIIWNFPKTGLYLDNENQDVHMYPHL